MIRFKRAFKIKNTQSKLLLRYESNSGVDHFDPSSRNRNHHGKAGKIGVRTRVSPASPPFNGGSPSGRVLLESKTKRIATRDSGLADPLRVSGSPRRDGLTRTAKESADWKPRKCGSRGIHLY